MRISGINRVVYHSSTRGREGMPYHDFITAMVKTIKAFNEENGKLPTSGQIWYLTMHELDDPIVQHQNGGYFQMNSESVKDYLCRAAMKQYKSENS